MDPREMENLVQRLVANPHDQEALAYAHQWGASDPKSYAQLLEKVGKTTQDPAYASHWLAEAANVWSFTLGDAHRAASVLMMAVEKDPTQETAAERLAQLYREKGEQKSLVALLERRVKALTPLVQQSPERRQQVAQLFEELGRLWAEPPLSQPRKAIEHYRRAIELDPRSVYAIYGARELYKQAQQWADAIPLFDMEQAIVDDIERKVALYRDEAQVRKDAGDGSGAAAVLRHARTLLPDDVALMQELGTTIVDRRKGGEQVPPQELEEAAQLFVSMAETYGGEHGYAYSVAALRALPGHDRAMQLADYFGKAIGQTDELPSRWSAYLEANPNGFLADEARANVAAADPAAAQRRSVVPPAASSEDRKAQTTTLQSEQAPVSSKRGSIAPGAARPKEESKSAFDDLQRADAISPEKLAKLLQSASESASRGNKADAFTKYKEVLAADPANAEALPWVKDHMRQKRLYPDLRTTLQAAARAATGTDEKKTILREVAALCEQQLRDVEGAIHAWKQLVSVDRSDASSSEALRRLLEKSSRWDELASVLEDEAMNAPETEEKLVLEKKLAQLHETKRKDLVGAGEAWARIARLVPDDDQSTWTAVKLFDRANKPELGAQVIQDTVSSVQDQVSRASLYTKLGELEEKAQNHQAAGDAYSEAATISENAKSWESAERCYATAERWTDAARALDARAELAGDPKTQAGLFAKSSSYYGKAEEFGTMMGRLEQATELDPMNDEYASELERHYITEGRQVELAELLAKRADGLGDRVKRVALRKRAVKIQREDLDNADAARETLLKILEDGDDEDALELLAADAEGRDEYQEAVSLLRRLSAVAESPEKKKETRKREALILAENLADVEGAIARYESILSELDEKDVGALTEIAALEERRENPKGAASALERHLVHTSGAEKLEMARRLADLYEHQLQDDASAIKALEIVVGSEEEEDFEAVARLATLTERAEDWPRTAELLKRQIEVEADPREVSELTLRLANILSEKLDKGDEALAALEEPADSGLNSARDAYIALGDKLGWSGLVATKLVTWNENRGSSPERNEQLRAAYDRFVKVGRDEDAIRVGAELVRSRAGSPELAKSLEEISVRAKSLDGLQTAHDLLARELSGPPRAEELVRQAEVLMQAGVDPAEALAHGESALGSVPAADVEGLLARLTSHAPTPAHAIDLYERQVSRVKLPADRLAALTRAAQVAAEKGAIDRARGFFEIALSAATTEEAQAGLEAAARATDAAHGTPLLKTLAESFAAGGQGTRDGGRTRSALLRRAANIAKNDLKDVDLAFTWLGDALVTHVDQPALDAVFALGEELGDLARVEATLSRALSEVFDGPLVRQLLARRATVRRDRLGDKAGAAQDLKKLHDLSPADQSVMDDLSALLTELGDFRGMVQVLEDQILRGKDPAVRADLARRVAVLWEERLGDAREAADAWRRVLRMKAGDPDATAGLERAKTNSLKKAEGEPIAFTAPVSQPPASMRPGPGGAPASIRPGALAGMAAPSSMRRPSVVPPARPSAPPSVPVKEPSATIPKVEAPPARVTPVSPQAAPSEPTDVAPKSQRPDVSFAPKPGEEVTAATPVNAVIPTAGATAPIPTVVEPQNAFGAPFGGAPSASSYGTPQFPASGRVEQPAHPIEGQHPDSAQHGQVPPAQQPQGNFGEQYPQGDYGQHNQGQYPQGDYGQHNQGQYPQGDYNQGQHPQGDYGQQHNPAGQYGYGQPPASEHAPHGEVVEDAEEEIVDDAELLDDDFDDKKR